MKLGRNEPCHCGSGKKYKQCHLKSDQQRERAEKSLRTMADWTAHHGAGLRDEVTARVREGELMQGAVTAFFEAAPEDPFADPGFAQHALYDLGDPPAITEASADDEHKTKLREALAASYPSLLECVENKPGKGVRLKDRLVGRELWIGATTLSEQIEPLEVVLGRMFEASDRKVLHDGWEKVGFRGRKAAIRDLEAAMESVGGAEEPEAPAEEAEEADEEAQKARKARKAERAQARIAWLKAEAGQLYQRARAAAPAK